MKLKRDVQGKITVLTLSETYTLQDLAVLRAGVTKLATGGQDKLIILDVSGAKASTPSLAAEIKMLPGLAAEHQVALLIAGPEHAELGGATLEDAKRKLLAPEFRATLDETFLNAKFNQLERRKKELLEVDKKASSSEQEILALQKRNRQLKRQFKSLLSSLSLSLHEFETLIQRTPESAVQPSTLEEWKKTQATINPILDQLGVAKL